LAVLKKNILEESLDRSTKASEQAESELLEILARKPSKFSTAGANPQGG
jgi:hypothetical protein